MKYFFSLILLLMVFYTMRCQEEAWYSPGFELDFTPRMFYWDTTTDWFYIGGNIALVDSLKVHGIFRIDSLENVDYMDTVNICPDVPLSMTRYQDTLYMAGYGGLFAFINSACVPIISNKVFYELSVYNNEMLVGGYFWNAISGHDGAVIEYNGNQFNPFYNIYDLLDDSINPGQVGISSFQEYDDKLYIAGNFEASFNGKYNEILSWDGMKWDDLDGGIPGNSGTEGISDMVIYKNELYVGGGFNTASGSRSNNILKWDGESWSTIGNGIYGQAIMDMHVYRDELWVVGSLDSVDHLPLRNVAIWNGEYWCSPGGYFQLHVLCMGEFRDTLYVGGNFWHIDGDSTRKFIAKYNPAADRICGPPVGITKLKKQKRSLHFYPNPNQGEVFIETTEFNGLLHIDVYNLNGDKVSAESKMMSNMLTLSIPGENGLYVVYLRDESGKTATLKVMKEK